MPSVCMKDYIAISAPVNYPYGDFSGNHLLLTTENFSSDMPVNGVCLNSTDLPTAEAQIMQVLFVAPFPPSGNMIVDGTAYGSVGIQQVSTVGAGNAQGSTVTRIYASVVQLTPTSSTSISGGDQIIWQGANYVDGGNANTPNTAQFNIPFWLTIDNAQIQRNCRIGLMIKVWGYCAQYYTAVQWNKIGIVVNAQNKTTSFSLPIAVQGDF